MSSQVPLATGATAPPTRSVIPHPNPEPTIDVDDIQGDIYPSFPKKVEVLIFFRITDPTQFKSDLKGFLPTISTAKYVLDHLKAIQAAKHAGHGLVPSQLFNIGFSHKAFSALGITGDLQDTDFAGGQLVEATKLGDPVNPDGSVDWDAVWKEDLHGVFIIAAESIDSRQVAAEYATTSFRDSIDVVAMQGGHVRDEKKEHFGFVDGISQPAIQGLVSAHPGQAKVEPGVILMGQTGDPVTTRPSWAKNGSVMVFRKLQQFVPEFHHFLQQNPINLPHLSHAEAVALMGAKMVGRWPSGAPIDLAPERDDPTLGADPNRNNNFDYQAPPGGEVRCPYVGHIRKTSPRVNTLLPPNILPGAHILRAGIPYGPEVTRHETRTNKTVEDRGLVFICYQSTLAPCFLTLQVVWANNPSFPPENDPSITGIQPGLDPIIGNPSSTTSRQASGMNPSSLAQETNFPTFVVARGGEYFFMPSMTALRMIADDQPLGN